jgi:hypothetical protein
MTEAAPLLANGGASSSASAVSSSSAAPAKQHGKKQHVDTFVHPPGACVRCFLAAGAIVP